jgi:hypothetical protein
VTCQSTAAQPPNPHALSYTTLSVLCDCSPSSTAEHPTLRHCTTARSTPSRCDLSVTQDAMVGMETESLRHACAIAALDAAVHILHPAALVWCGPVLSCAVLFSSCSRLNCEYGSALFSRIATRQLYFICGVCAECVCAVSRVRCGYGCTAYPLC